MRQKKWFFPAAAFILPVFVMLVTYISLGISPFGDQAEMIIDSYHQYVPFFSEFHYKIWHGQSLLYSWHGSLGYNFLPVISYYLASPLNFILALFPEKMMIEAFQTLIVIKIGICGLSAYTYLSARSGRKSLSAVVFAAFYALGGFMLAYNWNVMWLDTVALFPFAVLGADKLIRDGDGKLYTIMMGLCVFSNYYIAIMVCIFMVLYFFACWFSQKWQQEKPSFLKRGLHFALSTAIGIGLAGVYLIPTFYNTLSSSMGYKPDHWEFYRSFFDMFRQHFAMLEPTQLTGAPNIYCGVGIFLLAVLFAAAGQVPVRERILKACLAAFIFISLNVNVLNYVWHGFHFPNNLPGRFSFLYIFLLVVMAYDAFLSIKDTDRKIFLVLGACVGALFVLILIFAQESVKPEAKIVTAILLAVYFVILCAHRAGAGKGRFQAAQLLVLVMLVELFANTIYGISANGTVTKSIYMGPTDDMYAVRDKYSPDSSSFYRMESAQIQGRDDIIRYNMNGLSFFSSTCDDKMEELMGALGYFNSGNKYSYKGATPLTDALIAMKYVASNEPLSGQNLKEADRIGDLTVYENTQPLSVGFMTDPALMKWNIIEGEPFTIQNDFARLAAGTRKNIFNLMDVPDPAISGGTISTTSEARWYYDSDEEGDGALTYDLHFDKADDVYIYFEADHCEDLTVVRGDDEDNYTDERGHIVHLGQVKAGEQISLVFKMDSQYSDGSVFLQMASYDAQAFAGVYDKLSENQLDVTSAGSTHISGSIKTDGGLMLLSVPYDQGWTIKVDGEKVKSFRVGEAFTGIRLEGGEHIIQMDFLPRGFAAGIALSAACLLAFILAWRTIERKM